MASTRFKSASIGAVAGLYGNRIDAVAYRRGGGCWCIRCPDVDCSPEDDSDQLASPDVYRTAIERTLDQYAASGRFTPTELRTLRALWLDHDSIALIAARESVSRQAVLARIAGKRCPDGRVWGGILAKALEFASDWEWIKRMERFW